MTNTKAPEIRFPYMQYNPKIRAEDGEEREITTPFLL